MHLTHEKGKHVKKLSIIVKFMAVACAALAVSFSSAQDVIENWELKRDRDGIQVYTRQVEGSKYDAVKTVTVMDNVKLASLVALISDAEACADWADRCAEAYVSEKISDAEFYTYTHNDMPFPVKDRDVVAHVKWSQDADSLEVLMDSVAVLGRIEEIRGRLRLTEASAHWRFKPLADGSVEISNDAHINPGSSLPGWVTNMLLVDTPFVTMEAFIKEVRKPKYRDATVSFITEP